MFWLLSWFVLLILTPIRYIEFINSKFLQWDNPYIVSSVFFVPVSYFISYFVKLGVEWVKMLFKSAITPILIKKRKAKILSLQEQDLMYLLLIFSQNQERTFRWDINENISSLCKCGMLNLIRYDGESSVFQINSKYLPAVQDIVMFNQEIRAKYF